VKKYMINSEKNIAHKLIETGYLVPFKVIKQDIHIEQDGIDSYVTVALQMIDGEGNPCQYTVEWGAFGFIFVLAILSFEDARPRGMSSIDYQEDDSFTVDDLFDCLKFTYGELKFDADYIAGRCMKTRITINKDGLVSISTRHRGKSLIHWLERLQGKKKFELVK
jgi:hypothetical protein